MSANLICKQEDQKYSDYTNLSPNTGLLRAPTITVFAIDNGR